MTPAFCVKCYAGNKQTNEIEKKVEAALGRPVLPDLHI